MSKTYLSFKDSLACLVPGDEMAKKGFVVTCHEKTLCDCTVHKIASEFQVKIDKLSEENKQLKHDMREIQMGMDL